MLNCIQHEKGFITSRPGFLVSGLIFTIFCPRSHRRGRDRSGDRISPYQFDDPNSHRSRSRQETQSYQQELERQIQEKRYKKQMEKEEQIRYYMSASLENLIFTYAKTKAQISCAVTAQLINAFVFAT